MKEVDVEMMAVERQSHATTISKMKEVDVEMMAVERVGNIGRGGALITKEQFVMVRTFGRHLSIL